MSAAASRVPQRLGHHCLQCSWQLYLLSISEVECHVDLLLSFKDKKCEHLVGCLLD